MRKPFVHVSEQISELKELNVKQDFELETSGSFQANRELRYQNSPKCFPYGRKLTNC